MQQFNCLTGTGIVFHGPGRAPLGRRDSILLSPPTWGETLRRFAPTTANPYLLGRFIPSKGGPEWWIPPARGRTRL
jgi:hypothetical protein